MHSQYRNAQNTYDKNVGRVACARQTNVTLYNLYHSDVKISKEKMIGLIKFCGLKIY